MPLLWHGRTYCRQLPGFLTPLHGQFSLPTRNDPWRRTLNWKSTRGPQYQFCNPIQCNRQNGSWFEDQRQVFLIHSPVASSERVVCVPHCIQRTTKLGQVVPISIVTLSTIQNKRVPSIRIPVRIVHNGRKIDARALLDSGAEGIYCNATFVKNHGFPLLPLQNPIYPCNVDGTINTQGAIICVLHVTWETQILKFFWEPKLKLLYLTHFSTD